MIRYVVGLWKGIALVVIGFVLNVRLTHKENLSSATKQINITIVFVTVVVDGRQIMANDRGRDDEDRGRGRLWPHQVLSFFGWSGSAPCQEKNNG